MQSCGWRRREVGTGCTFLTVKLMPRVTTDQLCGTHCNSFSHWHGETGLQLISMGRTTGWLGGSEFDLNGCKFAKPPVLCQDGITFHCKTLDSGTSVKWTPESMETPADTGCGWMQYLWYYWYRHIFTDIWCIDLHLWDDLQCLMKQFLEMLCCFPNLKQRKQRSISKCPRPIQWDVQSSVTLELGKPQTMSERTLPSLWYLEFGFVWEFGGFPGKPLYACVSMGWATVYFDTSTLSFFRGPPLWWCMIIYEVLYQMYGHGIPAGRQRQQSSACRWFASPKRGISISSQATQLNAWHATTAPSSRVAPPAAAQLRSPVNAPHWLVVPPAIGMRSRLVDVDGVDGVPEPGKPGRWDGKVTGWPYPIWDVSATGGATMFALSPLVTGQEWRWAAGDELWDVAGKSHQVL